MVALEFVSEHEKAIPSQNGSDNSDEGIISLSLQAEVRLTTRSNLKEQGFFKSKE